MVSGRKSTLGAFATLLMATSLSAGCGDDGPAFNDRTLDVDLDAGPELVEDGYVPPCDDECDSPGLTRCTDEGLVEICGDHDDDVCLEFGDAEACDARELCIEGRCVFQNEEPDTADISLSTPEDTELEFDVTASDADGDELTYTIVQRPSLGRLDGLPPVMTYVPDANAFGEDLVTVQITDGFGSAEVIEVAITVEAVNDQPIVDDEVLVTSEDVPGSLELRGTDIDGDELTFALVDAPALGSVVIDGNQLTFSPDADVSGVDSFTYAANDGTESSLPATVSVTINALNDAPVSESAAYSTDEDTPLPIVLYGDDLDPDDTLVFSIVEQPRFGVLDGVPPSVTYTPDEDFFGEDLFRYVVEDGATDSFVATINITVDAVDDDPVALGQDLDTREDTPIDVVLLGRDPDRETLTYEVVTPPTNGILDGGTRSFRYIPDEDFNGGDFLQFVVRDGDEESAPATVTFEVAAVNDAPVADNTPVETDEDTPVSFSLNGFDVEGTPLQYELLSGPTRGELAGTVPEFTYTPEAGFFGEDTLRFRVFDGELYSAPTTLVLEVAAVGDPPTAQEADVAVDEDESVVFTLPVDDSDTPRSELLFRVVDEPDHGTVGIVNGEATYTPSPNYSGPDIFTFEVEDDVATSAPAEVRITVREVNDPPFVEDVVFEVDEDTPVDILLTADDVDDVALTFEVVGPPPIGTLTGTPPNLRFEPPAEYFGVARFTYRADDGESPSNIGRVTMRFAEVDDVPIADPQSLTMDEDGFLGITLTGRDVESSVTYRITSAPEHGTLSGIAPALSYQPDANFAGIDTFVFVTNDGSQDSLPATVTITVNNLNDEPVAENQTVPAFPEDSAANITLTASDADPGDTVSYIVLDSPAHGTLSGTPPDLVYTPDPHFNGTDSFTFFVNDGSVDSRAAQVNLTVTPVEDLPTVDDLSVTIDEDEVATGSLTGNDDDGDILTFTILDPAGSGTALVEADGSFTYVPNENYNGSDSFTFTASDGDDTTPAGTVSITITPVNDLPVGEPGEFLTNEDDDVVITISATDVETPTAALTYRIDTPPVNGTLSGTPPELTYTPDPDYSGSDTFTFIPNDGTADGAVTTVRIEVVRVFDAPSGTDETVYAEAGVARAITPSVSDPEGLGYGLLVDTSSLPGTLLSTCNVTATAVYADEDEDGIPDGDTSAPAGFTCIQVASSPPTVECSTTLTYIDGLSFTYENATPGTYAIPLIARTELDSDGDGDVCTPATVTLDDEVEVGSSEPFSVTVVVRPSNTAPSGVNDSYDWVGNTGLEVDASAGLLINDTDPDAGETLSAVPSSGSTGNGGSYIVRADGSFSYTPPVGFSGADSFDYEVADLLDARDSGTVTLNVGTTIWYVNNTASAGGNGTDLTPFNALASALGAASANDVIAISGGDGTSAGYTGTFTIPDGGFLIGSGVDLIVDGISVRSAASPRPELAGNITTGDGCVLTGFNLTSSSGDAISGTDLIGVTISDLQLDANGASAIDITLDSGDATISMNEITVRGSLGNNDAISITDGSARAGSPTVSITGNTITHAAGATATGGHVGISAALSDLDELSVLANTITDTPRGGIVATLSLASGDADLFVDSNIITGGNDRLLIVSTTGVGTIDVSVDDNTLTGGSDGALRTSFGADADNVAVTNNDATCDGGACTRAFDLIAFGAIEASSNTATGYAAGIRITDNGSGTREIRADNNVVSGATSTGLEVDLGTSIIAEITNNDVESSMVGAGDAYVISASGSSDSSVDLIIEANVARGTADSYAVTHDVASSSDSCLAINTNSGGTIALTNVRADLDLEGSTTSDTPLENLTTDNSLDASPSITGTNISVVATDTCARIP